jgi:tripartite-type tricarboxylate transporter receptor subunit TctC
VPFKGAQPAVTQTLGGEVKVLYMGLGGVLQYVKSGKLAVLGVAERSRTALLPGVQTLAEQGVPGVEVNAWYGVFAPMGTAATVIARVNTEVNAALKLSDVVERLAAAGIEVTGGTPEALARDVQADYARYGRIVKEFGIQAD